MEKGKIWNLRRGNGTTDMITLTALALLVVTVLTLPFAASKYAATGTGMATARIAKWDVMNMSRTAGLALGSTIVWNPNKTSAGTNTISFTLQNKSEVACNYKLELQAVNKGNAAVPTTVASWSINTNANVTGSVANGYTFAPGSSSTGTITFPVISTAAGKFTAANTDQWDIRCSVTAVQVD